MTTAQLDKMRAGREAQLARQREANAEGVASYRAWITSESEAFAKRANAEELHGRDSDEFREADSWWHEVWSRQPTAPPDHAWKGQ